MRSRCVALNRRRDDEVPCIEVTADGKAGLERPGVPPPLLLPALRNAYPCMPDAPDNLRCGEFELGNVSAPTAELGRVV